MNADRFLKLADHLEFGQLGHKRFDMNYFNTHSSAAWKCGTAGCALGECPIVFPRHWKFEYGSVLLRGSSVNHHGFGVSGFNAAAKFFDVDYGHIYDLFMPHNSGKNSRRDVARRIRRFVRNY